MNARAGDGGGEGAQQPQRLEARRAVAARAAERAEAWAVLRLLRAELRAEDEAVAV